MRSAPLFSKLSIARYGFSKVTLATQVWAAGKTLGGRQPAGSGDEPKAGRGGTDTRDRR
jgi:hypothetical protein